MHRDKLYAISSNVKSIMNNVVNLHAVSVLAAIYELQTGEAVGPDGIPAFFYTVDIGWLSFVVFCNMCLDYCYLFLQLVFPLLTTKLASCQM